MWGLLPLDVRLTYKGLRAPSVVVDCFYTAIFSALSSRLNALPCDSDEVMFNVLRCQLTY